LEEKKGWLFMRRILLIVAMLLIGAAPAMATVTVTARHIGLPVKTGTTCSTCEVNYVCSNGEKVRAFALEVTVDSNYTITAIKDFNVGESNKAYPLLSPPVSAGRGYGIFPGKFRDDINAGDPCWNHSGYNPIAPVTDTDAPGTGLGTGKIIVEMGSLYVGDLNAPPSAGVLFKFDIMGPLGKDCNLAIVANATRGGVVLESGETLAATFVGGKAGFPDLFPCYGGFATQYNEWVACFKPKCWTGTNAGSPNDVNFRSQCWGDADGKFEGPANKYRVFSSDYTKMVQAWGKKATALRAGMGADGNWMCADFDHKYEGPANKYRVFSSDYTRMLAGWGKKDTVIRSTPSLGWCPQ
jgi:hypothetical protein